MAEQGELRTEARDPKQDDQLRTTLADTYTLVRSREINKTISSFTFDHYIDEAKRAIKEDRKLRTASGVDAGIRPSQLAMLERIQTDFGKGYSKMKELAEASDKGGEQETEQTVEAEQFVTEAELTDEEI